MAEQAHPSLTRNADISRGEPQSASQSRIPTAALIGRWLDQARPRQRLGQVIVQFNPRVGIAWRSSELFEDNLASLLRRRTCAAQIEALEQVVRLRLGSGEVVPAVLPPESIQADVEFFQRVFVCRRQNSAHYLSDQFRGRSWRQRGSPRIFRAKCASNAVSFLALRSADREFIVDIGEDRDVGVDPSRQAAAKLQHGGLA